LAVPSIRVPVQDIELIRQFAKRWAILPSAAGTPLVNAHDLVAETQGIRCQRRRQPRGT